MIASKLFANDADSKDAVVGLEKCSARLRSVVVGRVMRSYRHVEVEIEMCAGILTRDAFIDPYRSPDIPPEPKETASLGLLVGAIF